MSTLDIDSHNGAMKDSISKGFDLQKLGALSGNENKDHVQMKWTGGQRHRKNLSLDERQQREITQKAEEDTRKESNSETRGGTKGMRKVKSAKAQTPVQNNFFPEEINNKVIKL